MRVQGIESNVAPIPTDGSDRVMVDVDDYPTVLGLVASTPPEIIGGPKGDGRLWVNVLHVDDQTLREKYDLVRWVPPLLDVVALYKVLAKIAHAYTASQLGREFHPFLPSYILDRADELDHPSCRRCRGKPNSDTALARGWLGRPALGYQSVHPCSWDTAFRCVGRLSTVCCGSRAKD